MPNFCKDVGMTTSKFLHIRKCVQLPRLCFFKYSRGRGLRCRRNVTRQHQPTNSSNRGSSWLYSVLPFRRYSPGRCRKCLNRIGDQFRDSDCILINLAALAPASSGWHGQKTWAMYPSTPRGSQLSTRRTSKPGYLVPFAVPAAAVFWKQRRC